MGAFAVVLLHLRSLLVSVARARTTLFSVFLLIPIPVVIQLASRAIARSGANGGAAGGANAGGAPGIDPRFDEEEDPWDPQLALAGGAPPIMRIGFPAGGGVSLTDMPW